jgi:hypothetical protein
MERLEKSDELRTGRTCHPGRMVYLREVRDHDVRLETQPTAGGPDGIFVTVLRYSVEDQSGERGCPGFDGGGRSYQSFWGRLAGEDAGGGPIEKRIVRLAHPEVDHDAFEASFGSLDHLIDEGGGEGTGGADRWAGQHGKRSYAAHFRWEDTGSHDLVCCLRHVRGGNNT